MNANSVTPLPMGSVVGVLGGGQLGKMLGQAALKLGYKVSFFDPSPSACALSVGTNNMVAKFNDTEALREFSRGCDTLTTEWENVPLEAIQACKDVNPKLTFYPGVKALAVAQDRRLEKKVFKDLGLHTLRYKEISEPGDIESWRIYPCMLKKASGGYDGKGQGVCKNKKELITMWNEFKRIPCIIEQIIPVEDLVEISVIIARDNKHNLECYEPFHNIHKNGILRFTEWNISGGECTTEAQHAAIKIGRYLDLVGILCVEMFLMPDGKLYMNEIAPRPHNSGHLTIECAKTSQFEQLIRIATGNTVGSTERISDGCMFNLLGQMSGERGDIKEVEFACSLHSDHIVHLYGKESKKDRKIGHVTFRRINELSSVKCVALGIC